MPPNLGSGLTCFGRGIQAVSDPMPGSNPAETCPPSDQRQIYTADPLHFILFRRGDGIAVSRLEMGLTKALFLDGETFVAAR